MPIMALLMPIITSQILKYVYFTKTQKSRYLKNKTFFLQIKKFISYTSKATFWQKNSFIAMRRISEWSQLEISLNTFFYTIETIHPHHNHHRHHHPGSYLGQISSGKLVGTKNWKCLNRDIQKNAKLQNN